MLGLVFGPVAVVGRVVGHGLLGVGLVAQLALGYGLVARPPAESESKA